MRNRRRLQNWKRDAPPPTPAGKVWMTKPKAGTRLYSAKELHEYCKTEMDAFDALPEAARAQLREVSGSAQDKAAQEKAKANARTATAGFGLAF